MTNQPPAGGTVEAETAEGEEEGTASAPISSSQNTTRNYELDKTLRYTQEAKSLINRLTVAVVVDNKDVVNEAGETVKTPLEEKDIELIRGIVRDAIGFNEERGDSVTVYNSNFLPETVLEEPEATPIWKQPWLIAIIKQVFAGISVLIILFMFVKPAMKTLMGKHKALPSNSDQSEQPLLEGGGGDTALAAGGAVNYPNYVQQLAMAKELVSQDPKQVAKIVKSWVAPDGE